MLQSQKLAATQYVLSERKQAHVGMEPSKTKQTRWEWYRNTFTPCLHFVPFCQLCLVLVICAHWRVVEGSNTAWVCSVCWCAWRSVAGGCNLIATDHGRRGLSYIKKLWSPWAVLSLYGMLKCEFCCELLLLLNMPHMGCLLCGRLWSEKCLFACSYIFI